MDITTLGGKDFSVSPNDYKCTSEKHQAFSFGKYISSCCFKLVIKCELGTQSPPSAPQQSNLGLSHFLLYCLI